MLNHEQKREKYTGTRLYFLSKHSVVRTIKQVLPKVAIKIKHWNEADDGEIKKTRRPFCAPTQLTIRAIIYKSNLRNEDKLKGTCLFDVISPKT
jgi:hypothetical protein